MHKQVVVTSKKKPYPDAESVLEVVRTRNEMGLPLSPGQLNKGKYADPELHQAGIRLCGSWQRAVESAGFDYAETLGKARSRYPTAESVIREIKDRHKSGLPLNSADVRQRPGLHRDIPLHSSAQKYFGSWRNAIGTAGLDYSRIYKCKPSGEGRRYPDKDSIVDGIRRRAEAGLPLNGLAVAKGKQRDHALYRWGMEYFGGWAMVLEAAGIDPDGVHRNRPRRYPDKASVVAEIHRRKEAGLPVTCHAVAKGRHGESVLYKYAMEYFGRWDAVLEAAGISYEEVRYKDTRRYPDAPSVVAGIKRRAEAGLPLNGWAVAKGEQRDLSLHVRGQEYLGSWPAALKAAGFDPEAVCKRKGK